MLPKMLKISLFLELLGFHQGQNGWTSGTLLPAAYKYWLSLLLYYES